MALGRSAGACIAGELCCVPAMLDFDARKFTASAATATATAAGVAAKAVKPLASAYSPIVLAGTVRLIEFALILLVGTGIYVSYVVPIEGFEWHYVPAI